ncbi:MDR family MFS transporter [Nocardioides yefusunii]|uniref:MDR family MFS transporter n=1 Tax=Nocardioides yefusunii TaxID=2500546 RepID=A0ABW1R0J5_9ACTN|nr:MDR family MFS transporter [Nocardioides yefusunii]
MSTPSAPAAPSGPPPGVLAGDGAPMTHKQILQAMSGLLLGMFAAMTSSTIVNNALPPIVTALDGTQTGYTWVVVGTLLAMTATTPIWGKLADLFDQKKLVQIALVIFAVGSLGAGLADDMKVLIGARVVQGIGIGGLTALIQVVIASMVPPRERGRYAGYTGSVFAAATVAGPLVGGLLVDTLGWRWCFFAALPLAVIALVLIQGTLHLAPRPKKKVTIDYLGSFLLMAGVSLLLVWVSLAGNQFDWASNTSYLLAAGSIVVLLLAVLVEAKFAVDPVLPLRLFADRTTVLATFASVAVGIAMFGSSVYLSQYFQLSRGMTPTKAGLMSICMVGGTLVSSMVSGKLITTTGKWKRFLVLGGVVMTAGMALLATIDRETPLAVVGLYMLLLGLGVGLLMQNLVLAVQNVTPFKDMGAASALVAFFRSIGGSAGVAALGAVLAHQVSDAVAEGMAKLGLDAAASEGSSHSVPNLSELPGPVRLVFENAYGDAVSHVFLFSVPFAVIGFVLVLFIKEVPLRTTVKRADELKKPDAAPVELKKSDAAPVEG